MPACDMCGKEAELFKTRVEGTNLDVCKECSRFGTVLDMPRAKQKFKSDKKFVPVQRKEVQFYIVDDYATLIRQAREKIDLNQEEFSKKLNEKSSVVQKIETGHFKPSIEQARKFERILRIKLVEQDSEAGNVPVQSDPKKSQGFTMADFIKVKKK